MHQIPLMGDIYTKAASTYVWLGDATSGTDRAMQYFSTAGFPRCFQASNSTLRSWSFAATMIRHHQAAVHTQLLRRTYAHESVILACKNMKFASQTDPMAPIYAGLTASGVVIATITRHPANTPAHPTPAMALPTINTAELRATPHIKIPTSKRNSAVMNDHRTSKCAKTRPYVG
jgi:hypothetical protein